MMTIIDYKIGHYLVPEKKNSNGKKATITTETT